ncbi:unnamed protein product [Rhizophagus irregularis]|uniref:F-box domain-containing protein n=1 Tax=Rhizophagus irregularis TaxID=588596 RepID=A0A916E0P8_9GLOM|nr:unnamed protein product [Rhizophagus irregularis]CAB4479015.1 unnamed protein product [Rhizophagus irregularis]CAB5204596.1 unnamed protein product [Rhizophagus irregularis]CAB5342447.1 unnamed protein product [Rhizophagus irregularis]CAB5349500.1 unnamed protein product [Rhizophagus irregularis]
MASKLNDDCLSYIFKYLEEDSFSLFACILVDKQWCRTAVPILWSNPWNDNKRYYGRAIRLIDTATFEYEKFMKNLNIFELEYRIRKWVSSQPVRFDFTNTNQRKMKGGKNNRNGILQPDYDRDTRILMSELLYLFLIADEEPEARKCLQNLQHLRISTHQPISTCLMKLSDISRNIEYLEIENCNINSFELKRLINVQNNLKNLTVEFVVNQPYQIHNVNNVLSELSSKAKSITRIKIKDAADIFIIFNSFVNLIELIINNTDKCDLKKWEHLSKVESLKKLKKLVINNKKGPIYFNIIAEFIERSSCDLDQIVISTTKPQDPTYIGKLINSISRTCPNLTVFEGLIGNNHINEFSQLLQTCNNLKYLHIYPVKTSWENEVYKFDDILQQMIQYLPFNLNKLFLEDGWLISDVNLFKKFLEGRKLLELSLISFHAYRSITYNYQELEDICENYKENDYLLDYHFYSK